MVIRPLTPPPSPPYQLRGCPESREFVAGGECIHLLIVSELTMSSTPMPMRMKGKVFARIVNGTPATDVAQCAAVGTRSAIFRRISHRSNHFLIEYTLRQHQWMPASVSPSKGSAGLQVAPSKSVATKTPNNIAVFTRVVIAVEPQLVPGC